jgi:hypothetical protein
LVTGDWKKYFSVTHMARKVSIEPLQTALNIAALPTQIPNSTKPIPKPALLARAVKLPAGAWGCASYEVFG